MKYEIDSTYNTPYVLIDGNKHIIKIQGKSIDSDRLGGFYDNVFLLIEDYINKNNKVDLLFDMEYVNTVGVRMIKQTIEKLTAIKITKIVWVYESEDDSIEFLGRDLSSIFKDIQFNFLVK